MVKPGAVVIDVGMNRNDARQALRRRRLRRRARGRRLDHPGARRRRPDDDHDAARQHPGGAGAAPRAPRRATRCSPSAGLPRFDAMQPGTCHTGARRPAGRRRGRTGGGRGRRRGRRLRRARRGARPAGGAPAPRLGHRSCHLQSVADTPALRAAYAAQPAAHHRLPDPARAPTTGLYRQDTRDRRRADFAALPPVRRKAVADALRDFVLGGAELRGRRRASASPPSRARCAELSQRFGENVLDATDAWSPGPVARARLAGVPADVLQAARERRGTPASTATG